MNPRTGDIETCQTDLPGSFDSSHSKKLSSSENMDYDDGYYGFPSTSSKKRLYFDDNALSSNVHNSSDSSCDGFEDNWGGIVSGGQSYSGWSRAGGDPGDWSDTNSIEDITPVKNKGKSTKGKSLKKKSSTSSSLGNKNSVSVHNESNNNSAIQDDIPVIYGRVSSYGLANSTQQDLSGRNDSGEYSKGRNISKVPAVTNTQLPNVDKNQNWNDFTTNTTVKDSPILGKNVNLSLFGGGDDRHESIIKQQRTSPSDLGDFKSPEVFHLQKAIAEGSLSGNDSELSSFMSQVDKSSNTSLSDFRQAFTKWLTSKTSTPITSTHSEASHSVTSVSRNHDSPAFTNVEGMTLCHSQHGNDKTEDSAALSTTNGSYSCSETVRQFL